MKLKQSVKEKLQSIAIIGTCYLVIFVGIISLGWRIDQLNQQKMTDTYATNISQK